MAVIITNMDMPTSCSVCPLEQYSYGDYWCSTTSDRTRIRGKNDNCPLKSIDEKDISEHNLKGGE